MTRTEFDEWITRELPALRQEISKRYRIADIDTDIAEFYLHVLGNLEDIRDPRGYLWSWVYNRNYKWTRKKNDTIYTDVLPDRVDETDEYDTRLDTVYLAVSQLALPEKILYELYYVRGYTTRKIAKMHGLSHTGVAKQLIRLQKTIKEKL